MNAPELLIVDRFLSDPDQIRRLALDQKYASSEYHKGKRTTSQFLQTVEKSEFERLMGRKILRWEEHQMNGVFQFCTPEDPLVFHSDGQSHAAVIFLTPNAPIECGISLYKSRVTGLRRPPSDFETETRMYHGNLLDRTKWIETDRIGNIYNRLVIWDAKIVHAATGYFGTDVHTGRLFQIFFFDAE